MAKIISLNDLLAGVIHLSEHDSQVEVAGSVHAPTLQSTGPGKVIDLRSILRPGTAVGWSGRDLVFQTPTGEVVLVADALEALVGEPMVFMAQPSTDVVEYLVLTWHDAVPVLMRTFVPDLHQAPSVLEGGRPYRAPDLKDTGRDWEDDAQVHYGRQLLSAAPALMPAAFDFLLQVQLSAEVLGVGSLGQGINAARYGLLSGPQAFLADLPPVANPDALVAEEDGGPFGLNVLLNDWDPEFFGDGAKELVLRTAFAANGTVSFDADGQVRYTPDPNFFGQDVITYQVADRTGNVSSGRVNVVVQAVNDAPILDAGKGAGQPISIVYPGGQTEAKPFADLVVFEPDGDTLARASLTWNGVGEEGEEIGVDGAFYAFNFSGTFTNLRGDSFTFANGGVTIDFVAGTTAKQAQDVLHSVSYRHVNRPPIMEDRVFTWTIEDITGLRSTDLSITLDADVVPRVRQQNLEISHVDVTGNVLPHFDWRAGELLRVRWFDSAKESYEGDGNRSAGLTVSKVQLDLTALGMGLVQMDDADNDGVWEYVFDTSGAASTGLAAVASPADLLNQLKVQLFAALGSVNYVSAEVQVNRIVLAAADNFAEGTAQDDVFLFLASALMPSSPLDYSHVINGGGGFDELDLSLLSGDLLIDALAQRLSLADGRGMDTFFLEVERFRVQLSDPSEKVHVRLNSADEIAWSQSGSSAIASVDLGLDGVVDLQILFVDQLVADAVQRTQVV